MPPVKWNAEDYAKHSQGQLAWARSVLERLEVAPDAHVLDIGCGDGKVSAELARIVPEGRVVGIDNDSGMIALAQRTWCPRAPNLEFLVLDAQDIDLVKELDFAFSNSTLHWVPDHLAVLRGVYSALKTGGRLFFSMGSRGTASAVYASLGEFATSKRWASFISDARSPHYFFGPEEYKEWLPRVGLSADRIELIQKPLRHANLSALEGWLRTTWMTYTDRIPAEQRGEFLSDLTALVETYCDRADDGAILVPMMNLEVEATRTN